MKYLKKVSASQLISNEGTIIDSMNPGDDQTVNAPSIHAVKDYVENYSTTEQRIGTWLGKPLYAKMQTITVNHSSSSGDNIMDYVFPHNIANVDEIFIDYGKSHSMTGYNLFNIYPGGTNNYNIYYWIRFFVNTNNIICQMKFNGSDSGIYRIILNYTKTTD